MAEILKKNRYVLIGALTVLILLGVWEIIALAVDLPIVIPTFSSVFLALFNLLTLPETFITILHTLLRCTIGYILAFVLAFMSGIIAGRIKAFAAVMAPVVTIMRSVPVVAITLIVSVWINSAVLPALVGILLVFPVIYEQAKTPTENMDPTLIDVMKEMGGGFWKDSIRVYVPMMLPYGLSGISATFGMNMKAVISAELLAYSVGSIGYAIYFAKADFLNETPVLFAWAIIAIILAAVIEFALKKIFAKVCQNFSWL